MAQKPKKGQLNLNFSPKILINFKKKMTQSPKLLLR